MEITKATIDRPLFPELREWMDNTGHRQYDLARILGISTAQTSRYLTGKQDVSADRAIRLAAVTNIPPERLVSNPETARILKLLGKRSMPTPRRNRRSRNVA